MATKPLSDLTATWNAGGTTFTAVKMNVTDTASAAASNLLDLQVGGSSRFSVRKDGFISASSEFAAPTISTRNNSGALTLGSSVDVILTRDAADTLAQRRGVNAQTFRVYNTFTDASNYERGQFAYSSNILIIGHENAGTGASRAVQIRAGSSHGVALCSQSTVFWQATSSGHWFAGTDNTYDIGASGANRPRNIYTAGSYYGAAAAFHYFWGGSRTTMASVGDGLLLLQNSAGTDFSRLQFGGTTSSFPALKRNATAINVRLADDSADAPLTASNLTLAMTAAGSSLDITNSDPGNLGVAIQTRHNSASPAVDDYVGYWNIRGNDSLGNNTLYGWFQCLIVDPTDGSEKGQMYIGAGGGSQLQIGQGVHTSGATAPGDVNVIAARQIKTQARTVAQLPAAGTVGAGTRGWVSDSNVAFSTAVITNIVAGGGANGCPVYSDGTNWRIG